MPNRLRQISQMASVLTVVVGLSIPSAVNAEAIVEWQDLLDPASQEFEDPYESLEQDALDELVAVARLRERQERTGALVGNDALRLEASLSSLEEQGIDVDWLISQRWIVAERRKLAATLGNSALDEMDVSISGFAIPAPADDDGTAMFYLVELPGLCSHLPPPPPNQLVRIRFGDGWTPEYMHQPVSVTGRLHIDPTEKVFRVVDGDVPMNATWKLEAAAVKDFRPDPGAAGGSSDWIEQLRSKLSDSRANGSNQ